MNHRIALATLAILLAACAPDEAPQTAAAGDSVAGPPFSQATLPPDSTAPPPVARPLPPRPQVLADSVRIEGEWQRDELRLVRSPDGFEPPFTTYLPSGLQVDFETSDSTPSVRFVAAFAGHVNPDAYLQLRLYPEGIAELAVHSAVEAYLGGRDPRGNGVSPSQGWPWTIEAWDFQYGAGPDQGGFMGTIGIARYGNRFFHALAHYPAEYGDGMGPRFHRILQEWRWEIDGARLVPD